MRVSSSACRRVRQSPLSPASGDPTPPFPSEISDSRPVIVSCQQLRRGAVPDRDACDTRSPPFRIQRTLRDKLTVCKLSGMCYHQLVLSEEEKHGM